LTHVRGRREHALKGVRDRWHLYRVLKEVLRAGDLEAPALLR
jgi:hypothetical protein